ncbi:glycerol-3-phosphate phosphatase (GppA), putative [Talaromyces stipitatus ATCC 10500]|uniref:Glycerol-3-phosphate phosphatase (GppA), putative n=1 Tax=Talaromyces stipitatus (strain ATCC 10500 / CBS 375.48 / QM 6759 / NRRL 1006) TaxID=441959 RepID=B8LW71_TALSN|nr:glycerol-3-phosphate phosphatase (GppA), putative [Talaromyces stipitatus ATCC 10500]EED24099.1 glycerol-3-phosphate phosphatase (GppA), putative [Talaromyces stipitatus ATCC 10500]
MATTTHGSYTGSSQIHSFDGLLFDFDGTIIDSTDAIVKHWQELGKELGVDPEAILATSHGRRSIDTLALYDKTKANWKYVSAIEGALPRKYGKDATELPGARDLLNQLVEANAPWAVVTSGTRALVTGWLEVLKLGHPKHLVVAEDVEQGKPDPQCYQLGRSKLSEDVGFPSDSTNMLVVEDAPSGIKAGKAAGFKVLALETTHTIQQLKDAGADWIVKDLRSVQFKSWSQRGKVEIEVRDTLQS